MSLRCCKFCYKLATDEKHTWFCPFSDWQMPIEAKKASDESGKPNGGSGGGPGEPNTPIEPFDGGPTGGAITWQELKKATLAIPKVSAIEKIRHGEVPDLMQDYEKPAMIENKPTLALPSPGVKDKDEQTVRDNSVGKS